MRDPRIEQFLAQQGIEYEYEPFVPLEQFDFAASHANQARLPDALNPEVVERYAAFMRDGVEFPALVGFVAPSGLRVLNGGNHRLHAARDAGKAGHDLYRIEVDDHIVRGRITRSLNLVEAPYGMTPAEAMAQAIAYQRSSGCPHVDAARLLGAAAA
jgi:hypothetical protein